MRIRLPQFLLSPLTRSILAVNVLALILLVVGLLLADNYRGALVRAEFKILRIHADILAPLLSENATVTRLKPEYFFPVFDKSLQFGYVQEGHKYSFPFVLGQTYSAAGRSQEEHIYLLSAEEAGRLIRNLDSSVFEQIQIRVFDHNGLLLADNSGSGRAVSGGFDLVEVGTALGDGVPVEKVRTSQDLTLTRPIMYKGQVVGVIMVRTDFQNVMAGLFQVWRAIFFLFLGTLLITLLLSFYLSGKITSPLIKLAEAAKDAPGRLRGAILPDFSGRRDEIGALSSALLRMTKALQERLEATERFAADVAHEIKNPLSSLRNAAELLLTKRDPEKQEKLISVIREDGERMDRLITDISNLSRLDAELARDETKAFAPFKVVKGLIDFKEETKSARPGTFVLDWPPAERAVKIQGREERFAQVVENLLSNALSFSPEGGKITIRAGRRKGMFFLTVRDEGPGIPQGSEKKIFERFYSARSKAEPFGTHSGLGLSISRHIIEGMGGRIVASSLKKKTGAVFFLLLPLLTRAAKE